MFIELLCQLIQTPSISRSEEHTADLLAHFLAAHSVAPVNRLHNNVWVCNKYFDESRPTILLNSHHDTVKPNSGYSRDPYHAEIIGDRLYGLGSNDAGASLVGLVALFLDYYQVRDLRYNLCLALTAEEECSGARGIESILPNLGVIDFAIIGEPTSMQMAVAERGLMVLDCVAHGRAGHAARDEGDNAIYRAMKDIEWFSRHRFDRESLVLGSPKMSVTVIEAGSQHNVVPAECRFTVDVRTTDCYTNQELLELITSNVDCSVAARSTRLEPSSIALDHPIVEAGRALGMTTFGSPTMSDQALLRCPSLKLGIGDSARSHTADEFVLISEIESGIALYRKLLKELFTPNLELKSQNKF